MFSLSLHCLLATVSVGTLTYFVDNSLEENSIAKVFQLCYVQEPPLPSPPPRIFEASCGCCIDCSLSIASWIFLPRNWYFFRTIFLYSSSSRSRIRKKLFSSGRVNASHWNKNFKKSIAVMWYINHNKNCLISPEYWALFGSEICKKRLKWWLRSCVIYW